MSERLSSVRPCCKVEMYTLIPLCDWLHRCILMRERHRIGVVIVWHCICFKLVTTLQFKSNLLPKQLQIQSCALSLFVKET